MNIQVLGPGCSRCKDLYAHTQEAVLQAHLEATIEKVEDMPTILKYGIMSTPALVVDGVVKLTGRVASVEEIRGILEG